MRYIGNKTKLLDFIEEEISSIENVYSDFDTLFDVFSGTGCVGKQLKTKFHTYSCDLLYSSYILSYCNVAIHEIPKFEGLVKFDITNPIEYLNSVENIDDGFVFNLYSENGNSNRLYFSKINGMKIDSIMNTIQYWYDANHVSESEYLYLKGVLLNGVSKVANITGVYGAYLKSLSSNAKKTLQLCHLDCVKTDKRTTCLHGDSNVMLLPKISEKSILYLDPPYNNRQYGSNYHVLETIARCEKPYIKRVRGKESVAGLPENLPVSNWCKSKLVRNELIKYLSSKSNLIVMSYNSESHLTKEEIIAIMEKYGRTKVIEKEYKKFKSNSNQAKTKVNEYLFICDKRVKLDTLQYSLKPVVQWVGGKGRLLKDIKKYIPTFQSYFELFAGGGALLFNLLPKKAHICEINTTLYELYMDIQTNPTILIAQVSKLEQEYFEKTVIKDNTDPDSRSSFYYRIRRQFNYLKLHNLHEDEHYLKSSYFLFLNKTGFNGLYRENSSGELSIPFGNGKKCTIVHSELINQMSKYLKDHVCIHNMSFNAFHEPITQNDFVYLDPPYHKTFAQYHKSSWSVENTEEVIKLFHKLTLQGTACILSNNNNDEYIEMVRLICHDIEYQIIPLSIARSLNSDTQNRKKTACEIIVINKYCDNFYM